MKDVNVGIIGCGVIAPSHIESYRNLEGVRLAGVCDPVSDRVRKIQAAYPELELAGYASLEELLSGEAIDAVSICTDHASHEALFLEALAAGCHVLCEKALTTSPASLERMLAAAEASDRVSAAVLQHRFDPINLELKRLLDAKALGRLLTVSCQHQCFRERTYYSGDAWRGTWEFEGGSLLINQSIHFLDILQWLAGGVDGVEAATANLEHEGVIETEDTASLLLRLRTGGLGSFVATSGSHRRWDYAFQFVGSEGLVEIFNGTLKRVSHRDPETEAAIRKALSNLQEDGGVSAAKDYYGSGHPAQVRDFVGAIREGRLPRVSFADAREALEIVFAAYAAAGRES